MKQPGVDSQNETVLHHMQKIGPITPAEAYEKYGILRLGARRFDLIGMGYDVRTNPVKRNGKRFAEYSLPLPKGQLPLFQTKSPQDHSYGLSDDRSLGMDHNKSTSCQAAASAAKHSNANRCRPLAEDGAQRITLGVSG